MARLILTSPEGQQVVTLAARNSLGRHPDSSIQILDKIVSKEHCRISLEGKTWVLQDLDSLNGTFLNGARLSGSHTLQQGDEFTLGATRARFEQEATVVEAIPPTPAANTHAPNAVLPGLLSVPGARAATAAPVALGTSAHRLNPFEAAPAVRGANLVSAGNAGQTLIAAAPSQIEVNQQGHEIGTQIAAQEQGFRPFQQIASN